MPCTRCGTDTRWARIEGTDERIQLENLPSYVGPDRYREVSYQPLVVEPIPTNDGVGYVQHDCQR